MAAWQSVVFDVPGAVVERLSDALLEAGAASVDARDASRDSAVEPAIFGEPGETPQLWSHTQLSAIFGLDVDAIAVVRATLADEGLHASMPLDLRTLADEDWVRLTQQQFQPIRITARLWIVPTWHAAPDPKAINLVLDPGVAFGTGSHPTTRLCLQWLAQHVHGGESVLDFGCGSGILAIAAMKLGAVRAAGVDIDPQALLAAERNALQNRVAARFSVPETAPPDECDIVVANILANPLKTLSPTLVARVRGGGSLVLSGILPQQADGVAAAYAESIPLTIAAEDDGWVLLAGTRP